MSRFIAIMRWKLAINLMTMSLRVAPPDEDRDMLCEAVIAWCRYARRKIEMRNMSRWTGK